MKIVIAPDSFKESLPAVDVAKAIAGGVLAVCPDAQIDLCPMADGGEGTVEALVAATGGRFCYADVFDPLGGRIRARFGMLGRDDAPMLPGEVGFTAASAGADGDGSDCRRTAIIEMAAASGIELVPPDRRDPARTTTYGTGQLIIAALDEGADEIILGIGGSATVDCGCGCAQALGVDFYDADGEKTITGMSGGALESVASIDLSGMDSRLQHVRLRVACDVNNPLTGPSGAAAVYGPQKGATPETVQLLERGMVHISGLIKDNLDIDISEMPGAGASGGLGAGLVAFAGAVLENGGKLISSAVGLEHRLTGADLCITGEGKIDSQSGSGKVPLRVANLAGKAGVSTVCIAGIASDDAPSHLFREIKTLVSEDITKEKAMSSVEELLSERAKEVMMNFTGEKNG